MVTAWVAYLDATNNKSFEELYIGTVIIDVAIIGALLIYYLN